MADLSTYIELHNNTPYTLKFASETEVHGDWNVRPPATIASLKSASFSMKDPSWIIPAGSEGTVTYQVAVPDTNEESNKPPINVTFIVRFCDSYSADNNYCIFITSHPELFAIYFEAKTGNDDWHKNHCPQSGHPVYLRLFIKATS
ncbi:hypothetical protein BSPLISOX_2938 [uncultured Gammaproteobacteria bacterium]|jgi:hypothetical protein|nr:hypothetical protein [uncultured Gammaproteobacteria bacterium]CAC9454089.1 hypothetical protein [uncultured Gammaproteobacteria bacterium]CAC9457197.1 hypothetical protein [uncultured Gammaproteobacteria bacterium]VVH65642.1 hypothetical protein BSPLISOX_2938 [uncultured Gammaproteobacteria bacterium]